MVQLKEYSPKDVNVILGGAPVTGFEEGTFITIVKDEDSFSSKSGIEGDGIRINKQNNFYTVEFTLLFTSASNTYLSALAAADYALPGAGKVPLQINNSYGNELFNSVEAWCKKIADTNYSDGAEPKTWTLGVFNPLYLPNGS